VRSDVALGEDGRLVAEDEEQDEKLAGSSGRAYDLLVMGGHGIGRQPFSQLGGVTARVLRKVDKDLLVVRNDRPLAEGRWMVCVDGSSYAYKALRVAVCNVEKQAFAGTGNPNRPPRFCSGGPGNEPADPPPPPVW